MLIVEDDETIQFAYRALLRKLGVRFDIASTGEEALDLLSRKRYRLVLMDLNMPGQGGFSAARQIRESHPVSELAIVAVTAEDKQRECLEAGMNAFYRKPLLAGDLKEIIDCYLRAGGN